MLALAKWLVPPAWQWLWQKFFPRHSVPGVTMTTTDKREATSVIKYKLYVNIKNDERNLVVLGACDFTLDKNAHLKINPEWPPIAGKRRQWVCKYRDPKGTGPHDQPTAALRKGESTSVWIGIDPTHGDPDIKIQINKESIGTLDINVTLWDETGSAYNVALRVKV